MDAMISMKSTSLLYAKSSHDWTPNKQLLDPFSKPLYYV